MAEAFRDWLGALRNFRSVADEYRQLERGRVLVLVHRVSRGKASAVEVAESPNQGAHLFELRDGKVTRLIIYVDREHALADLGLEEGTAS